jgi:hypothetical protein
MDLYQATFAGSLVLNAFAFYQSHRSRKAVVSETSIPDKKDEQEHVEPDTEGLSKLRKRFFPIYLLVNAADWLQGPYIYPIYKGTVFNIDIFHHNVLIQEQMRRAFRKKQSPSCSSLASSQQAYQHPS